MDKIYDEYFDKIYNWSLKKTNNKEEAEDLTNSIFLSVFEYFNKDIKIEKLENLIWKIARNTWYKKVQGYIKEKNNISFDEEYHNNDYVEPLDKVIYKEICESIENLDLKEIEKKTFNMYYYYGFSVKEISNTLKITDSTVKYYLYKTRNKIKEEYYG